ncbi:MAG TPA: MFS transporter [Candidatus Limnocylindria bacterium]|nr:MFS transporter [Candidatus Limnocylindria bacterium]
MSTIAPGSRPRSSMGRVTRGIDPALWLLAAIGFISQVGISVMLPLLPLYATELGAPPFVLGLLTGAFATTNAIGQFGTGFLTERWGARRMMTAGLGLYASMNALIATAATAGWLLAWRSAAGFGGGAMIVAERIYLAQSVAPARRAFANGIVSAGQSAGTVAGPVVGGVAATIGGLRAPFVLVALTSMIALAGTLFLPAPRPGTEEADAGDQAERIPIRPLATLLVANMALLASYGGFITTYATLATIRLGWTLVEVGIAFSFFGAGSILLGPWLAHLADRVGRRRIAMLAPLALVAFGLSLVVGLPQVAVFGIAVAAGGGLTAFSASWYALLADSAGERRLGRIFGVVNALSTIGIVAGSVLAAELWSQIDITAGMAVGAFAPLITVAAMLAFRPRTLPSPA